MKELLEHKPYSLQEKDYYEVISIGKHHSEIKIYDVMFEGDPIFEHRGERQSNELINFLNGAFLLGVSSAMANRDHKFLKHNKPYWFEKKYHSSALTFMGILGKHHWHIYFEGEQLTVKGTREYAETLTNRLNAAYNYGVLTYINKKP